MNQVTENTSELIRKVKAAKRVSTPLVAISTPDIAATVAELATALNGSHPQFVWDVARGLRGRNEKGVVSMTELNLNADDFVGNPVDALEKVQDFPAGSTIYFYNAQRFWSDPIVMQSIWNLRDKFKTDKRMLVLLGHDMHDVPAELSTSIIVFDEPLPNDEQLEKIVREQLDSARDAMEGDVSDADVDRAIASLRGTAAFQAEQLAAMSLRKSGIALDDLRSQSHQLIEETPGLSVDRDGIKFDEIGGLERAKEFGGRLFNGPQPPRVVVRLEELEKVMGGAKTDMSGTSQDSLQVILSAMEDNGWGGMIAYGAPGAGKSLFSKALAAEHEALPMQLDLNATKGSLVGQSEQQVRKAMDVIQTIGKGDVFFIASVNSLDTIPPELQRRFKCGVWFFDVPSAEERQAIWAINRQTYDTPSEYAQPSDDNLTGADIRNVCEMAHKLQCTLVEALEFTVPLKIQSPAAIEDVQKRANGKFLSASTKGVYRMPKAKRASAKQTKSTRSVELD